MDTAMIDLLRDYIATKGKITVFPQVSESSDLLAFFQTPDYGGRLTNAQVKKKHEELRVSWRSL
jgi:hypothetical protein